MYEIDDGAYEDTEIDRAWRAHKTGQTAISSEDPAIRAEALRAEKDYILDTPETERGALWEEDLWNLERALEEAQRDVRKPYRSKKGTPK